MNRSVVLLAAIVPCLVAGTTLPAFANPTQNKFFCGRTKNVPTTMAHTSRGPVPVIRWLSTLGETYTPEYRCQIVSDKFQTFYNDGTLNFLTTGVVNQQKVICAAQFENGPCSGVLFTLKPNSDPAQTLKRLLSVRDRAPNLVLNESAPQVYINVQEFLETAPVATEVSTLESPSGQPETSPPPNNSGMW